MSEITVNRSANPESLAKVALIRYEDLEITTIFDGDNYNLKLELFRSPQPERLLPLLEAANLPAHPMVTSVNAFLVRDEGRIMLVDAGMGHYSGPTMGHLVDSLALAGVKPRDVTDVVLTHLHRDHAGGLMSREETATFPNAMVHVSRKEFDYWTDPALMENTAPEFRHFVQVAQTAMQTYEGRLLLMDATTQVTERVSVSPIAGHTPGHTAIWLRGEANRMCMWGDIVHCAALQCPIPEITVCFDADEARARETRRQLFARAAQDRFIVCGAHLPFPGVGWMETSDDEGYCFHPLTQGPSSH